MVDTDKREVEADESLPTAPALDTSRTNFDMGLSGARDYNELLRSGVARENPGAPIPYGAGAAVPQEFYGTNTLDTDVPPPVQELTMRYGVPSGTHKDPMATWVNDGTVPPSAPTQPSLVPQANTTGRTKQFAAGDPEEHDYR